jgi:biopolymer transport protein ExbD
VLLVVLIFLMLSTTYSRFTELQINLPAADADKLRERPAEIIVSGVQRRPLCRQPQGRGRPQRRAADLRTGHRCRRPARHGGHHSADALAAHQAVVNVLDAARRAGLSRLTFAAQAGAGAAR